MARTPPPPPRQPARHSGESNLSSMWPVWSALAIVAATCGWLIAAGIGFDAAAWYASGWFWLVLLVTTVAASAGLAVRTRDRVGERMQTAIVLSLFVHIVLAIILKEQFISLIVEARQDTEQVEIAPLPRLPQYFFPARNRSESPAFAAPLATARADSAERTLTRQRRAPSARDTARTQRRLQVEPAEIVHQRREQTVPRRTDSPARLARQTTPARAARQSQITAPTEPDANQTNATGQARPSADTAQRSRVALPENRPRQSATSVTGSASSLLRARRPSQPQSVARETPRRQVEAGRLAETSADSTASPQMVRSDATQRLDTSTPALARNATRLPAARSTPGPTLRNQRHESTLGRSMQSRRTRNAEQPRIAAHQSPRSTERVAQLPRTTATGPNAPAGLPAQVARDFSIEAGIVALSRAATSAPARRSTRGATQTGSAASNRQASIDSTGAVTRASPSRFQTTATGDGNHLARRQAARAALDGGAATARDPSPSIAATQSSSEGAASVLLHPAGTQVARTRATGRRPRRGNLGHPQSSSRLMQSADSNRGSGVPSRAAADGRSSTASAATTAALSRRTAVANLPDSSANVHQSTSAMRAQNRTDLASAATQPTPANAAQPLSRSAQSLPSGPRTQFADGSVDIDRPGTPGVADRRAHYESQVVRPTTDRFLRRRSAAPASPVSVDRTPTAPFARRATRQQAQLEPSSRRPSPQVESAIENGLAYLASIQLADGRWTLQHVSPVPVREPQSNIRADSAATGMALLAFLGAGYDHLDDRYHQQVRRGLEFLVRHQQADGDLYLKQDGPSNGGVWLYSHGIAALALCEAFGMTGDAEWRPAAQRALDFIAAAQHPQRGGWRYAPRKQADLSVSGWQLMALRSGQLAGLDVRDETMQRTRRLLGSTAAPGSDGAEYVYNPWGGATEAHRFGQTPNAVMTAVGLLMRLYTGSSRDDPALQRGADVLLSRLATNDRPPKHVAGGNPSRDTYYWYNATQVMFHMRGAHWRAWQDSLYPMLIATQQQSGPLRGSWDPYHPQPDRWGYYAGRLYFTALNLLSLEVYHRHLPLFDAGLGG